MSAASSWPSSAPPMVAEFLRQIDLVTACELFATEAECVQRWLDADSELDASDDLLTATAWRFAEIVCRLAGSDCDDDLVVEAARIARTNGVKCDADWTDR